MNPVPTLNLGMSPAAFLARHWQKRPLLIRAGFEDFRDPLSPEELAGLACEPEVESRLVLGSSTRGWELRHGPFAEASFTGLPALDWSLLVQDVDKHLPALADDFLEPFRFVPDWRIDDLMVSYAVTGGSVGPHLDSYDVFLVQGLGRRRWEIGEPLDNPTLRPDLPLRILADFRPTAAWELQAGDMLYLPPGVPHHGVALEPCLTYSVGFRSPAVAELLMDLAGEVDPDWRYRDPDLTLPEHPGKLDAEAVARVRRLLETALARIDDDALGGWFARVVTSPKLAFTARALDHPFDETGLLTELSAGEVLERNPGSRWAFRESDDGIILHVDGRAWPFPARLASLVRLLCQRRRLDRAALGSLLEEPTARQQLLALVNEGYLLIYDDEEGSAPEP